MSISRHEIFKNVAWLGGTLHIAGTLRYLIQETMQPASKDRALPRRTNAFGNLSERTPTRCARPVAS